MKVKTYGLGVEPNGITTQSVPNPFMSQTFNDPFDNTNLAKVSVPQVGLGDMWDWGQSSLPEALTTPEFLSVVYGGVTPDGVTPAGGGNSWLNALKGLGTDFMEMPMTDKLSGIGNVASGLSSIYSAYTTGKQAKREFEYEKQVTEREWDANRRLTNADLADRQAARRAANSSFESVDSYMSKYGVK